MTQPLVPDLGAMPWNPKRGLKVVREFNRWDVPVAGLLRSRRWQYHLFRCMDGASGQYSVWAYAPLTRAEARALMTLSGVALRERQIKHLLDRELSIAVAEENDGVVHRVPRARLEHNEPEPQLAPEVRQQVQEELELEAKAISGMPIFAI